MKPVVKHHTDYTDSYSGRPKHYIDFENMNLSIEGLEKFLKAYTDDTPVGLRGSTTMCPVNRMLRFQGYDNMRVQTYPYQLIIANDTEWYEFEMPADLTNVILRIDCSGKWTGSAEVTAGEVRHIIAAYRQEAATRG